MMINKKHVAFFIGAISNKGGTERITISLANQLIEDGYQVSILSLAPAKNIFFSIDENINVYSLLSKETGFLLKWPFIIYLLNKIVKEKQINILIDVDVILSLFSLPVKLFNKKLKIVSWEHFNYKTNLGIKRRDLARRLSKRYADAIVTLTDQDKAFYIEDGKSKTPIYTISNFMDSCPDEFADLNNKRIVAVGRFTYQKGFDILIDVWNIVKQSSDSDGWILQIIGDGNDKDSIRQKITTLDLDSTIQIIDANDQIADYYLQSSIYVMTSRFEGLPMVLIEAKSYGLPIVAFDCLTGPRDLIEDGIDGYLIPYGENKLMAEKICFLMADSKVRKQQGEMAILNSKAYSKLAIKNKWDVLFEHL